MIQIAIFNNKGGVGKTTYLFHIAHILVEVEQLAELQTV